MITDSESRGIAPQITTLRRAPRETVAAIFDGDEFRGPAAPVGTRSGWPMRATYLLSDTVAIGISVVLISMGSNLARGISWNTLIATDIKLFGLLAAGLLTVAALLRTYAAIPPRPVRQFRGWVMGSVAVCSAEIAALMLLDAGWLGHGMALALTTALAIPSASFFRAICRSLFGSANWWGTRLIVVGGSEAAAAAFADLDREPQWGLRPVGFIDHISWLDGSSLPEYPNPAGPAKPLGVLDEMAERLNADRALVAIHSFDGERLADLISRGGGRIRHWIIVPPMSRFPSLWLQGCEAARLPALAVTNLLAKPMSLTMKRVFDLTVMISLGVCWLPLVALIAVLIKFGSAGPILYGQKRIGRGGRRFTAWKFRTMFPEAEALLTRHLAEHPALADEWAANHKLKRDPRVTWIGRWLRSLSLDELPQIWNVLVGEMSLVGPRPIVAAEVDKYADRYQRYTQVLPGITGLWQVSGRNNTTYEQRVDLDVYYVQNWSLWFDLYILACTVKVVLLGEGAY